MGTTSTDIEQAGSVAALSPGKSTAQGGSHSALTWALVLLPFAYLWFHLMNNLRLEWTTNPQYSYGCVVPLLCIGLLVRRWHTMTEASDRPSSRREVGLLFVMLAFLYLPTRLIEEATPEWRPIQWLLGIETIGLTLCTIYLGKGRGWLRQVFFPICFFFVAIPWPTPIEAPVIQTLTRINSSIVVELLWWKDIPAVQHGNVIEVSTGMVGVTEACSGIRSFQTSLMISLFFGEFYRMGWVRRSLLVPAGFILAMAFNVCRMTFLTVVAATRGVAAISQYHDPAGIMITVACTAVLWGLALLFQRGAPAASSGSSPAGRAVEDAGTLNPGVQTFLHLGLALLVWLIAVEAGAALWYRHVEANLKPGPAWTVNFPSGSANFVMIPIAGDTESLLRYDEAKQARWTETDGTRWQVFYCSWNPGRVAGYLAKRHTPEICLQGVGWKMLSGPELEMMNTNGVQLPIRSYVFENGSTPIYVFHCRWEAGVSSNAYVEHESARFNLVRGIWAGRGNKGQKILEIVITGVDDAKQAREALARRLGNLIAVVKS